MIVRKTNAQIVFGVIAVLCTIFMVVVQMRNLSEEGASEEAAVEPAQPVPAAETERELAKGPPPAPGPKPAPEPDVEPEPAPEPDVEPEPEPEPFVMKPVGGKDAIDGEYLVSFFNENDRAKFVDAVRQAGGTVLFLSEYGNVAKVRLRDAEQLEEILRAGPLPLDYSANHRVYYPERPVDDPPKPDRFYGIFGKNSLLWLGLKADHARWGEGVKVAILDNGVLSHPAFLKGKVESIDLLGGRDTDGASVEHGTAVASLIAGWHPDMMGVAPGAEIVSVRVTDGDGRGDVLDAARGIMKALESGAKVINISLGTYGDSFVLKNAVAEAVKRGVAVVAAVGNDGKQGVLYPAAYDDVVGVSAVDALGQKLYFGNTGEEVDITAPGYGVKAAWSEEDFNDDFSGTSAATPFVSGMIAVLMGRGLSAEDAIERVTSLADDAGEPGRDDEFGNGILDIRRIEEHGEKGIRDAALSCLLFKDGKKVVVGMQNRGTEALEGARIAIKTGGRFINFDIGLTTPGQTVSREFEVRGSDYDEKGALNVTAEILQAGLRDMYPGNNTRRIVVLSREPTPSQ